MKRFAILCGIIAAFLCIAQSANAQYVRKGANIVDQTGYVLSDAQLINLVGEDTYEQTVVGARKQYKAGNGLIWGGIAGVGAGMVCAVLMGVKMGEAGYSEINSKNLKEILEKDPSIGALYVGSSALMSIGGTAFNAGIVLKTIGKKRLNWVGDQANAAKGYSLNVGATPNGMGLYMNF